MKLRLPGLRHAEGTVRIPLFPLRTVLFPGGLLPLKVFEQRYIAMTKACVAGDRPFGVCLITHGDEVSRPGTGAAPEFARVGTLARITAWDMPQLGILHVAAEGATRFKVERHEVEASGLVERQADAEDARSARVGLTTAGKRAAGTGKDGRIGGWRRALAEGAGQAADLSFSYKNILIPARMACRLPCEASEISVCGLNPQRAQSISLRPRK